MYSLIFRNTHKNRIGFTPLNDLDRAAFYPDYKSALRTFKEEFRHLERGGMILLTDLSQPELLALDKPLAANHPRVYRQGLSQGMDQPIVLSTQFREEEIDTMREGIYALEGLLKGEPPSLYAHHRLEYLNDILAQLQDLYLQKGVLRGLIWPDLPYGKGIEEEDKLKKI